MHYSAIFKVLGSIIVLLSLTLLVPLIYALVLDSPDWKSFLYSFLITFILGTCLALLPTKYKALKNKDAFAIVSLSWLGLGVLGGLPYYLSGVASFTDTYFETVSGFTTTGASIFTKIESLSHPILLWRSMTQWIGGMGIIVLSLAILPYLDLGGMGLFQAEVPGPTADKLTPRIADTAKVLWFVYVIVTIVLIFILRIAGMSWFDAIAQAFATTSTGGFSTKNASISGFHSPVIEAILIIFMFLAGANFALHYRLLYRKMKIRDYLLDAEFRFYLCLTTLAIVSITLVNFFKLGGNIISIFRGVAFSVVSVLTTTGYGTVDYVLWPIFGQIVLLLLMFIGACAGSTAGGIKVARIQLIVQYAKAEMYKLLHPNLVKPLEKDNQLIDRNVISGVLSFIFIYLGVIGISLLLVSLNAPDLMTAIGAVVSAVGDVGPGFSTVGPASNFGHLSSMSKWVLSFDMVLGRLEILAIVVFFLPSTWKE